MGQGWKLLESPPSSGHRPCPLPCGPGPGSAHAGPGVPHARLEHDPPGGLYAACEGLAGSEQKPGVRACRRVWTWRDFFQRFVYDNSKEELSVETLTQLEPSRVGAGAGLQKDSDAEGLRDRETETESEGQTHTETCARTRVHTHTEPAWDFAPPPSLARPRPRV